jgi:hypothetical protein
MSSLDVSPYLTDEARRRANYPSAPFQNLPGELRNTIYAMRFDVEDGGVVNGYGHTRSHPLMKVCTLFYREFKQIWDTAPIAAIRIVNFEPCFHVISLLQSSRGLRMGQMDTMSSSIDLRIFLTNTFSSYHFEMQTLARAIGKLPTDHQKRVRLEIHYNRKTFDTWFCKQFVQKYKAHYGAGSSNPAGLADGDIFSAIVHAFEEAFRREEVAERSEMFERKKKSKLRKRMSRKPTKAMA